jgi:hypothetical protein
LSSPYLSYMVATRWQNSALSLIEGSISGLSPSMEMKMRLLNMLPPTWFTIGLAYPKY